MGQGLIVTINDQVAYECDDTRQPARVRRHLEEIDHKLDQGIQLGSDWLDSPNSFQKSQYIAMNLLSAVDCEDLNMVRLFSAYLLTYDQELNKINAKCINDTFTFSLSYE